MIKIKKEDYEKLKDYLRDFIDTIDEDYDGTTFSSIKEKDITSKELEDFLKQLY